MKREFSRVQGNFLSFLHQVHTHDSRRVRRESCVLSHSLNSLQGILESSMRRKLPLKRSIPDMVSWNQGPVEPASWPTVPKLYWMVAKSLHLSAYRLILGHLEGCVTCQVTLAHLLELGFCSTRRWQGLVTVHGSSQGPWERASLFIQLFLVRTLDIVQSPGSLTGTCSRSPLSL